MRARVLLAAGLVLLPSVTEAQRRPRIRLGGQPPRTTGALPEGPAARPVHEALRYQRLRISIEGYPMVSRMTVRNFADVPGETFTTGGTGTRFEYRFHKMAAGTLDVTSSFIGGPVFNQTAELGFRIGPSRAGRDIVPFADARAGYFYSVPGQLLGGFSNDPQINFATGMEYAGGPAALAGGGVEVAATRLFSVTAAAMYGKARMNAHHLLRTNSVPNRYTMSATRFIVSLRYNGVRVIQPPTD